MKKQKKKIKRSGMGADVGANGGNGMIAAAPGMTRIANGMDGKSDEVC